MALVDFTIREIQKVRLLMEALRQRLTGGGGKDNLSITLTDAFAHTKDRLKEEAEFDLDHFLEISEAEEESYMQQFAGFNPENIDRLAELLYSLALTETSRRRQLLQKSLHLYRLNERMLKSFSFERNQRMMEISSLLEG